MQHFLRSLADYLWPVHHPVTALRFSPSDYLRFFIVLSIVLLSGPDVFLAADMIALLDFLGVVLFLTAFAVGYRAIGLEVLPRVQRFLFPNQWVALIKIRSHPSLVIHGFLRIGVNVLFVSAVSLGTFKMVQEMVCT
jgi:hypothetical protein